jgi:hypothetical protein
MVSDFYSACLGLAQHWPSPRAGGLLPLSLSLSLPAFLCLCHATGIPRMVPHMRPNLNGLNRWKQVEAFGVGSGLPVLLPGRASMSRGPMCSSGAGAKKKMTRAEKVPGRPRCAILAFQHAWTSSCHERRESRLRMFVHDDRGAPCSCDVS